MCPVFSGWYFFFYNEEELEGYHQVRHFLSDFESKQLRFVSQQVFGFLSSYFFMENLQYSCIYSLFMIMKLFTIQ